MPDRQIPALTTAAVVGMLALGLLVRLAVLGLPGHPGDVILMARWSEDMARWGPTAFYAHDLNVAIYPALLYLFWPLGVLLDGPSLNQVLKGFSIPFDLLVALVLYLIATRWTDARRALVAPALYLFNPAVILAGPVWGQVDAVGTLVMLLALMAVASGRFATAGALAVLAGLVKPHAGIVALVVLAVAFTRWRADRQAAPLLRVGGGALACFLLVTVPLGLGPLDWLGKVGYLANLNPIASLSAPNPWGVLLGYQQPDGGLFWIGAALALGGFAGTLWWLRDRQDLRSLLVGGLFLVFAFYFLPTRVHERYLFPAMALLAPLAMTSGRLLVGYLVLGTAFALGLLAALVSTTPFTLPEPWQRLMLQRSTSVYIGLTLTATAVALVLLLAGSDEPSRPAGERATGA